MVSGRRPSDSLWQTRGQTLTCWLGNMKRVRQHSVFVPSKHYVTSDDTDFNSRALQVVWIMRRWRQTADMTSLRPWQGRNDVTLCVITNSDNEYLHRHALFATQYVLLGSVRPFTKALSTKELTDTQELHQVKMAYSIILFTYVPCSILILSKFFHSPTDAQVNYLEKINIKIYIKTAQTCFGAVTPSSGCALFVLPKVGR